MTEPDLLDNVKQSDCHAADTCRMAENCPFLVDYIIAETE